MRKNRFLSLLLATTMMAVAATSLTACHDDANGGGDSPDTNPLAQQVEGLWWALSEQEGTYNGAAYNRIGQALSFNADGTGYGITILFDDESGDPLVIIGGQKLAPFTYTSTADGRITVSFASAAQRYADYFGQWTMSYAGGAVTSTDGTTTLRMEHPSEATAAQIERWDLADTYGGNGSNGSDGSNGSTIVDLSTLSSNYTAQDGDVLTGTLGKNVKISIAAGATVTLRNATISGWPHRLYKWAGLTCWGDATIILKGENTVEGFYDPYPGIYIRYGYTLTIKGSGSLTASTTGYGAGIGASYNRSSCGNIVIEGGTITAIGGDNSAGIGSSYEVACGDITIKGGIVTAKGGYDGPGIGGGCSGWCGNITISGGIVTATGSYGAAGIGSGLFGSCGNVTITDGATSVTANKGIEAPNSIGAGDEGKCGTVTIGGKVTGNISESPYTYPIPNIVDLSTLSAAYEAQHGDVLTGKLSANVKITVADKAHVTLRDATIDDANDDDNEWAGITCEGDATIVLSGENTIMESRSSHPGIFIAEGKTLTIKGSGSLTATCRGGSGIGGGWDTACGNIVIEGGTITAKSDLFSAGIGSGWYSSCGDITITGGTVTAKGDAGGAGIGSGLFGSCGDITITDGVTSVTANRSNSDANSIGAGAKGSCGTVTIGGTVTGLISESPYTYQP